jgi:hypothetical protein
MPLPRFAPHFEATTLCNGVALLPTHPIWSGLVADTALYTVIWFGVLVLPAFIRRSRRIRRGRCPECGYDRSGDFSMFCPECGLAGESDAPSPIQR